jgi:hypothetical protein
MEELMTMEFFAQHRSNVNGAVYQHLSVWGRDFYESGERQLIENVSVFD